MCDSIDVGVRNSKTLPRTASFDRFKKKLKKGNEITLFSKISFLGEAILNKRGGMNIMKSNKWF